MQPRLNPRLWGAYEEVLVANRKQRRAAERTGQPAQDTNDMDIEQGDLPAGMPAQPFPDHEEDTIFKAQMKVQNMVLGHWKGLLTTIGIGLLGVLGYGLWEGHELETQQAVQAELAKIDRKLPKVNPLVQAGVKAVEDDPAVVGKLTESAEKYEAIAKTTTGPDAVGAWLRAADVWAMVGNSDNEAAAYAAAHAVGVDGIVGWSASSAHAASLANAGDIEGAAAVYQGLSTATGLLAEQALLNLAELYEDAGRTDESRTVYTEFTTKFPESALKDRAAGGLVRVGAAQ